MQQLLGSVMTNPYPLCHTTLIASYPDSAAVGFHQDHHHWRGSLPVNLHEREFMYVQMLYYPNGFGVGDGGIEVLRGSHRRLPETIDSVIGNDAPTPDEEGVWRHTSLARPYVSPEVGIEPTAVALGRGSMIFLNGRTYHGVSSQPPDSERSCRLFANCARRHLRLLSLSLLLPG